MQKRERDNNKKTLEELVIEVKSVVKVTQGGRQRRFSACVVVGDRKGTVGLGIGKAAEVQDAVKKAIQSANKNLIKVNLIDNRTIPTLEVPFKIAPAPIKPAPAGAGLISGGACRAVLDLAGIKDVSSKSLGSNTKLNVATATMNALKSLKDLNHVCELRGKTKEEILG